MARKTYTEAEFDAMSHADIRALVAETEALIAQNDRKYAENMHAKADLYQSVADAPDNADHADIFDEFKRHYGGDAKVARKQMTSWAKANAKQPRELAKEPLSVQPAVSSGQRPAPAGYVKA